MIFTGQLPRKKAWELVKCADVCVSPIYPHEIFNVSVPTKLLEYMSLGRPVVANNQPMQKYLLEKSDAGLCVNYDEDEFANAILYLLKNPEKANEMGKKEKILLLNFVRTIKLLILLKINFLIL